ncbi:MAG: hypothetical protein IRZ02_00040 [Acidothermus sp.]|nr:hypothetical protein [Acidothermus sp.]MCL6537428.1 hypothetical protein [Acidothermus sp.]
MSSREPGDQPKSRPARGFHRRRAIEIWAGFLLAAAVIGAGGFVAGIRSATDHGFQAGYATGEIAGVREGRLLQGTAGLPGPSATQAAAAYEKGYTAGANDAFTLPFDGGWQVGVPYVVVLERGPDGITYRFASREPMNPGVSYYRCGSRVCSAPAPH